MQITVISTPPGHVAPDIVDVINASSAAALIRTAAETRASDVGIVVDGTAVSSNDVDRLLLLAELADEFNDAFVDDVARIVCSVSADAGADDDEIDMLERELAVQPAPGRWR